MWTIQKQTTPLNTIEGISPCSLLLTMIPTVQQYLTNGRCYGGLGLPGKENTQYFSTNVNRKNSCPKCKVCFLLSHSARAANKQEVTLEWLEPRDALIAGYPQQQTQHTGKHWEELPAACTVRRKWRRRDVVQDWLLFLFQIPKPKKDS